MPAAVGALTLNAVKWKFPLKHQLARLSAMSGSSKLQHVTLSTFLLISLFKTAAYFSKARYSQFVLKVPLNPNQSIIVDQLVSKFIACE